MFDFAGVSVGDGEARTIQVDDNRLIRITRQRRCNETIWDNVAHLYPEVTSALTKPVLTQSVDLHHCRD